MQKKSITRRPRRFRKVRRTYRKRRNFTRKMHPSNFPFPTSRVCKLKYAEQFTINPAVGTVGTYVFSANGLYDPNITGFGHQPYGFDQLCALYDHYVVLASKITFTVFTGSNTDTFSIGIKLDDDASITTTPNALLEQPYFKFVNVTNGGNAANRVINSVTKTFSANRFFKIKNPSMKDTLEGNSSSNPSEGAFFTCCLVPVDTSQDLTTYTCQAIVEYIAKFSEPKDLAQS